MDSAELEGCFRAVAGRELPLKIRPLVSLSLAVHQGVPVAPSRYSSRGCEAK